MTGALFRQGFAGLRSRGIGYERPSFAYLLNAPALIAITLLAGYPMASTSSGRPPAVACSNACQQRSGWNLGAVRMTGRPLAEHLPGVGIADDDLC